MCCALDNAIFFSYSSKHDSVSDKELEIMRSNMKENCAAECPKLWQYDQIIDDEDYDSEEEFYKQMMNDGIVCPPEFDENFKFGDPPF